VVGDLGVDLVGEVVGEEGVAGLIAAFDLEEELGVAFVGEVGGAGEVHEAAEVMDSASRCDGEPVIDPCVVGWAVAEIALQGDLEDAPVFVRDVGGARCEMVVCCGGVVVVRW